MAESGCTKLLVRHLPSQLNVSDKTDLLKHFGAKEVICMERRGKMVSIWLLICQGSVSVSIEFSLICTIVTIKLLKPAVQCFLMFLRKCNELA